MSPKKKKKYVDEIYFRFVNTQSSMTMIIADLGGEQPEMSEINKPLLKRHGIKFKMCI